MIYGDFEQNFQLSVVAAFNDERKPLFNALMEKYPHRIYINEEMISNAALDQFMKERLNCPDGFTNKNNIYPIIHHTTFGTSQITNETVKSMLDRIRYNTFVWGLLQGDGGILICCQNLNHALELKLRFA